MNDPVGKIGDPFILLSFRKMDCSKMRSSSVVIHSICKLLDQNQQVEMCLRQKPARIPDANGILEFPNNKDLESCQILTLLGGVFLKGFPRDHSLQPASQTRQSKHQDFRSVGLNPSTVTCQQSATRQNSKRLSSERKQASVSSSLCLQLERTLFVNNGVFSTRRPSKWMKTWSR
ncbi:uncharacterized protein LOC119734716 isoform X2 [Patiria miniata]|uniref:Uncharacterized protein n=1 Tax=Patiria miniata TaxID=46514 RepID=A0A914AKR2_PATMI|nr:uncharacterized protein LOC119734716 isoform X2 [Patiria miniata]